MLCFCSGKELFPTKFTEFLTSEPGEDEEKKKEALLAELQSVNDYLEKSGKPYFGGDDVCATDLSMAPIIKHVKIGVDEIKVCQRKHGSLQADSAAKQRSASAVLDLYCSYKVFGSVAFILCDTTCPSTHCLQNC